MSDPRRPYVIATAVLTLTGLGAIGLALAWTLRPLNDLPVVVPEMTDPAQTAAQRSVATLKVDAWHLDLWRPFEDVVVKTPPPPPPKPPPFTLFSISSDQGRRQAGIDLGETGLVFLTEGDRRGQVTVTRIEDAAVELTWEGRSIRLELER